MKGGGQILWSAVALFEMSTTSWKMGKTPYERRFGEPLQRDSITFGAAVEYHPSSPNDQARIHQFGKKPLPGIFNGCELVAWENLERRYFDRRRGRFGKIGRIRFLSSKNQRRSTQKMMNSSRWYSNIVGWGLRTEEPTLEREPTVRAEPTDDAGARADIWSIQGDFKYRHHSELRVSTLRAEGRNIPYSGSTLMLPGQHIRIWMSYKKRGLTIIGMSYVQKFVRFLDRFFSKFTLLKEKTNLHKDTCGPERE